jgi:hypothetical protein
MAKRKLPTKKPVTTVTSESSAPAPVLTGGPVALAAKATATGMREELDAAQSSMVDRYNSGMLTVSLDPERIEDHVGTDRQRPLGTDEEFEALRLNIEARGQTQPIRVRPLRSDWQPDAAGRARPANRFVLQSGRRRLAVCKLLGRPVIALVASPEAQAADQADLIERFSENTVRANLTAWERYLSIGEIALQFAGESQEVIAGRIDVKRPEISIGASVHNLREDLIAYSLGDVVEMNSNKIRALVKEVKAWVKAGRPAEAPEDVPQAAVQGVQEYAGVGAVTTVTARAVGRKMRLEFEAGASREDLQAAFDLFLADRFS